MFADPLEDFMYEITWSFLFSVNNYPSKMAGRSSISFEKISFRVQGNEKEARKAYVSLYLFVNTDVNICFAHA